MINKAILLGNLGKDPELRYTQSGLAICNLTLATSDVRVDKDGERQELTEWHRITVWKKQAENCAKFLKKGSKIFVEGKITTSKYQDKETGADRYSTDIQAFNVKFLSKTNDDGASQHTPETNQSLDDIPF